METEPLQLSVVERLDLQIAVSARIDPVSRIRQHLDGLELTQTNNEIISGWTPVQYGSLVSLSTTC